MPRSRHDRFRLVVVRVGLILSVLLLATALPTPANADHTATPTTVTIGGSFQSEAGCPSDFDPACPLTALTFNAEDGVWQGAWLIPAGAWEYKAALNGSWSENYGINATSNGPNIPISLATGTSVKFYYDHMTHWATDNQSAVIAVAAGSFQSELGCASDWDPSCLRTWLQDPDGDGVYSYVTSALPVGNFEVKAAINEGWTENYGAGGVPNGPNIPFVVPVANTTVTFSYVAATHVLTVSVADPGAPIAVDDTYQTAIGTPLVVPAAGVLSNDTDPDAQPLVVATPRPVSGPANGSVTLNADGSFTYVPNAGFAGTDSFSYRASDGTLSSNDATVTIVVDANGVFDDLYALIAQTRVQGTNPKPSTVRGVLLLTAILAEQRAVNNQPGMACAFLDGFGLLVRSHVTNRRIPVTDAAKLYAETNRIRALLGCSTGGTT
jgi:hypothetical protein